MIIHKTRLRNYCLYRDRELEFSPRLNLIVGPNGSGKSSLLNAVLWLLTGADRNEGVLADNLCDFAGDDEPAFGRLECSHAGAVFKVTRQLRRSSHSLEVAGAPAITGHTAVNSEILKILGVTKQQLDEYAFVRQRGVDAWFDKQAADRARELGVLFGVDKAEKVWDAIGRHAARTSVPSEAVNTDEIRRQLKGCEELLAGYQSQLQQYADLPGDQFAIQGIIADYQQTIDGFGHWERVSAQAETSRREYTAAVDVMQKAEVSKSEAEQDVQLLDDAVQSMRGAYDVARAELQQWAIYDQAKQSREALEQDERQFVALPQLIAPTKPLDYDATLDPAWQAEFERLGQEADDIESALRQLQRLKPGDPCPTCGNPADNIADHLHNLQERRRRIADGRYPEMCGASDDAKTYDQAIIKYNEAAASRKEQAAQLARRREALQSMEPPKRSREELNKICSEFESLQRDYQASRERLAEKSAAFTSAATFADSKKQVMQAAADAEAAATPVTREQHDTAVAARNMLQARLTARATLQGQIATEGARIEGHQQRLAEIAETARQRVRIVAALAKLETVRQILHRNEAPRAVTFTYLEQLTADINTTLALFDAPFFVSPLDDLSFMVDFTDGRKPKRDKRLSVGERIVLAMSFRMAINSTFAGDLGVLAMDEPTAGLDEHNLDCLPLALERLRGLSETHGLQVFFVTHEPRISQYFDTVIEIGP